MKIFYTTTSNADQTLEQLCPFGETETFLVMDGSERTVTKNVGSCSCMSCQYCYGKGFERPYGSSPRTWALVPKNLDYEGRDRDSVEKMQQESGLKGYRMISTSDHVKCAYWHCSTEKTTTWMKFRIWWWHHVGIKADEWGYDIYKWYLDTKHKIGKFFREYEF